MFAKWQPFCSSSSPPSAPYESETPVSVGPDNGLSPIQHQAITWTKAHLLLIGPLGINFTEIGIKIQTFHSRKCIWKYRLQNGSHFVQTSLY